MHVDTHQHFWRYTADEYGWIDDSRSCLRRDFLPEHLDPELKRAGFDGSIAVQVRQTREAGLGGSASTFSKLFGPSAEVSG